MASYSAPLCARLKLRLVTSITGNGNDRILVGNGTNDSVAMAGDGNDKVRTGDGSGTVSLTGFGGNKKVYLGSSGWEII